MRRRDFITLLGGVAAAWPLVARAQQGGRVRRIGVLMGWSESDPQYQSNLAAFVQELVRLGWRDGDNLRIEVRWTNAEIDRAAQLAKELVKLKPDVIVSGSTPATNILHRENSTIPTVFAIVADPVGSGRVQSLARPGGNITGFVSQEGEMGGKWLALLLEVAPRLTRVAIMFNPDTAARGGAYYLDSFEAAAQAMMVEPIVARVRNDTEIESAIASLPQENAALVVMSDPFMGVHRGTIISSLAVFARDGGLMSYGASYSDIFRGAAGHVDRILRGTKPADLPIELPIKFEMVINLKTAKALGLTIPESFLLRADEVIE